MKTIQKTLPTGIKTIQTIRNGKITITVTDSKTKEKISNDKKIITALDVFEIICIIATTIIIYSTTN